MNLVVAIDGPAGAGKSTVARAVAKRCGLSYVDTGAIYRALALKAKRLNISPLDEDALAALTAGIGAEDLSGELRTEEISQMSSVVSQHPKVRLGLKSLQRRLGEQAPQGAVLEGRDIGTVIFPDAPLKFFLTASEHERAHRRVSQLAKKGETPSVGDVMTDMKIRDERDQKREAAPLVAAKDALVIDTTALSLEKVIDRVTDIIQKYQESNK